MNHRYGPPLRLRGRGQGEGAAAAFTFSKLLSANLYTAVCEENPMSGIGAIVPAEKQKPIDEHRRVDRDGKKPPRQPPRRNADDDMVEAEQHKLDVEA